MCSKVKEKVKFLCLTKYQTMETFLCLTKHVMQLYGGVEV
jgi:hypothetical protein